MLEASAAFEMNSSVFRVVTQREVVWNRRFGTIYRYHLLLGHLNLWRWNRKVDPKRRFQTTLHRVTTQRTEHLTSGYTKTPVKKSKQRAEHTFQDRPRSHIRDVRRSWCWTHGYCVCSHVGIPVHWKTTRDTSLKIQSLSTHTHTHRA